MSTSGQVNTNTEYDSYFWVRWSQGSQDVVNNRTYIGWSCGVYCGHTFYSNAIKMSAVSINGTQVYGGGTYSNYSKGEHTIASGNMWIWHDTDGTKTFSISSFTGWLYSDHDYSSAGGNYTLPTIPMKATITAAADFTDVDNPSITVNNPGGFIMDVWLEPNPVGDHLCVRENISPDNTGQYTWTLTNEERDQLRNKCTGPDCTIRLGLYTYIGNTTYADYKDKKFTMTENDATKPSVNLSVALNNGSLPSKFDGMYIQGKSKVDVSMDIEGKYGASIASYSAKVDGKMYYNALTFTSDVIQNAGSVVIDGYATDSREIPGSDRTTVNVLEYSKPLVIPLGSENSILCYRSDGNGKRIGASTSVWIKAGRSYYNLSQNNKCSLQWRSKLATEQWNDSVHIWNDLLPKSSTADSYNALLPGVEFALKSSYTIQIRATDDIGEQDIKTLEVPTQDVAFHLGKGGKNVSIGRYCDYSEEYTFYSDWKSIFDNDVVINGGIKLGDTPWLELVYPVGSIYMSTLEVSPQDLFGGSWERLKDRFLLAAGDTYVNGTTGGAATHTLTEQEMPKHSHSLAPMLRNSTSQQEYTTGKNSYATILTNDNLVGPETTTQYSDVYAGGSYAVGADKAHNNMPPYLAVYMWRRTQ